MRINSFSRNKILPMCGAALLSSHPGSMEAVYKPTAIQHSEFIHETTVVFMKESYVFQRMISTSFLVLFDDVLPGGHIPLYVQNEVHPANIRALIESAADSWR